MSERKFEFGDRVVINQSTGCFYFNQYDEGIVIPWDGDDWGSHTHQTRIQRIDGSRKCAILTEKLTLVSAVGRGKLLKKTRAQKKLTFIEAIKLN